MMSSADLLWRAMAAVSRLVTMGTDLSVSRSQSQPQVNILAASDRSAQGSFNHGSSRFKIYSNLLLSFFVTSH